MSVSVTYFIRHVRSSVYLVASHMAFDFLQRRGFLDTDIPLVKFGDIYPKTTFRIPVFSPVQPLIYLLREDYGMWQLQHHIWTCIPHQQRQPDSTTNPGLRISANIFAILCTFLVCYGRSSADYTHHVRSTSVSYHVSLFVSAAVSYDLIPEGHIASRPVLLYRIEA